MNHNQNIPFLDLVTQHEELENDLVSVFRKSLRSGRFIGGPMVDGFEKDFAGFCDAKYCVGVGSGTDALRFALIAAGVKAGDTVVTVPNTFIATTEAISQAGAYPDFVDIDERTYNIDPEKLQEYLESECKTDDQTGQTVHQRTGRPVSAVVPVHLYGQMSDMDPILELAEKYHLLVIEDACQAHGAEYYSAKMDCWRRAGSLGRAAAFSFYPGKNLGACGEGGAVSTNDAELARTIRMLRDHGQAKKYYHEIEGYNGRLDSIKAGILQIKLRHLPEWNAKRLQNAHRYHELLGPIEGIITPYEPSWARAVYHLYIVRVQNRAALQEYLLENGIATGLHYPVPLHLQKAYAKLGYGNKAFPVSEKVAGEILSLPMFPELTAEAQEHVAKTITHWMPSVKSHKA